MSLTKVQKLKHSLQNNIHHINMQVLVIQEDFETIRCNAGLFPGIEETLETEFNKLEETYNTMKESLNKIEILLKTSKSNSSQTARDIRAYYSSINQESHQPFYTF